ncbi:hypothetical protein B1759_13620 [Rubrivirga sp. SAORIC476]|uniref:hypothetical protein n=1 Tax=Rubrivirga sp. SAORIC476 TaxID=1961794 RepID=UPI000BA8EA54|nr:hypothetical protein [Rubrivirga sp. SAORIC476]PAP79365.1 hypothetical protein B1759_13620 [Rubrivirga sp. SAORIC476]
MDGGGEVEDAGADVVAEFGFDLGDGLGRIGLSEGSGGDVGEEGGEGVAVVWLWLTWRSLRASRDAVATADDSNRVSREALAEARAANEVSRAALVQQARLEAYPGLYVEAEEADGGEQMTLTLYTVTGRVATEVSGILLSYNYGTVWDEEEQEPVEWENYEAVICFDIPSVVPGRGYSVRANKGGRSVWTVLVLQFTDVLGTHFTERYTFMDSDEGGGRMELLSKQPSEVYPSPRWVVGPRQEGGLLSVAEVVEADPRMAQVLDASLATALAEVSGFGLALRSASVNVTDVPRR